MLKNNGFHNRHSPILRAFSPLSLFSGGAPGVWYDPSDLTTLFQDSAGTTPVTAVEQPVGLMLDKSQGLVLGSELNDGLSLVANWTTFGTNTVTQDGDAIKITYTTGQPPSGAYSFFRAADGLTTNLTVGRWYKVSGQARVNSGSANVQMNTASLWTSNAITSTTFVNFTIYFLADNATTNYLSGNNLSAGEELWIRDVSVKELPGNHAFQATSASRPVLSARYNLLTKTEQFDDAVWSKNNATVTANAAVAPDGTTTADKLVASFVASEHSVGQAISTLSGVVAMSFAMKQGEWRYGFIRTRDSGGVYRNVIFDLTDGSAVLTDTGWSNVGSTPLGDGWYRCFGTMTIPLATNFATGGATNSPSTISVAGDGTSGIYIWGASLVPTNQSTLPYQRVNTATDYNTTGFLPFLKFDGVDDSLSTNSISFTATDKMSVFAGVRKLSATVGLIAELSANADTNPGVFNVANDATASNQWFSKAVASAVGGGYQATASPYASPVSSVLASLFNLSGATLADKATIRVNGVASSERAQVTAGTGNFGNYPLFIGRRNNASLPFNGQMYSMIIVGKAVTAGELSSTETYVNQKTGAYA